MKLLEVTKNKLPQMNAFIREIRKEEIVLKKGEKTLTELEKKFEKITLDLINLQLKNNFFNLVCDICEFNAEQDYEENEEIKRIKSEIFNISVSLEHLLAKDIEQRDNYINEINQLKSDLIAYSKTLFLYLDAEEILIKILKSRFALNHFKDNSADLNIDFVDFLEECERYIDEKNDEFSELTRKGKLMSCIPMRMPTATYTQYVKNSLSHTFSRLSYNEAKTISEKLKEKFLPLKSKNYNNDFNLIADSINEIFNLNIAELPSDDLEELFDDLTDTLHKTQDIISDLSMYFNDLNYLLNILSFCIDANYITDDDLNSKDIFYSLKNLNDIDDLEAFSDSLLEKSENQFEFIFEKLNKKSKELKALNLTNDILDNLGESSKICTKTFDIILTNHYQELHQTSELENINLSEEEHRCTKEQIDELSQGLIQFIADCKKDVDLFKYKELKRIFMKFLPCTLDTTDLIAFIDNALDINADNFKNYVIIFEITNIMEEDGFISDDTNSEHNCSCGHDHHHDHSCSCNHDHHHDHSCSCNHDHHHDH